MIFFKVSIASSLLLRANKVETFNNDRLKINYQNKHNKHNKNNKRNKHNKHNKRNKRNTRNTRNIYIKNTE